MSTKEQVISLIEVLPESVVNSLYDYVRFLAYENDDILTDEEIKSLDQARKDFENGIYYTHDEVWD